MSANEPHERFYGFIRANTVYDAMVHIGELHQLAFIENVCFLNHIPVCGFDIFGTVVECDKREKVYSMRVDDGTGTVRCVFFLENLNNRNLMLHNRKWSKPFAESKYLSKIMKDIQNELIPNMTIEIGDLVHIRGNLKQASGEEAELHCSYIKVFEEVSDESLDTFLRLELHKRFYDVKFDWSAEYEDYESMNATALIINHLRKLSIPSFTEEQLLAALKLHVLNKEILAVSIKDMLFSGFIYKNFNLDAYQVVEFDTELHKVVKDFIAKEERRTQRSVSVKAVHNFLKNRLIYKSLNFPSVKHCLKTMQEKSEIYSTETNFEYKIA